MGARISVGFVGVITSVGLCVFRTNVRLWVLGLV